MTDAPTMAVTMEDVRLFAEWYALHARVCIEQRKRERTWALDDEDIYGEDETDDGLPDLSPGGLGRKRRQHRRAQFARLQRLAPVAEQVRAALHRRLHGFAERLGLSHAEREMLLLAVARRSSQALRAALRECIPEFIGDGTDRCTMLATLMSCDDIGDVEAAMRSNATLYASGLLKPDGENDVEDALLVLPQFARALLGPRQLELELLDALLREAPASRHGDADFAHLDEVLIMMDVVLRQTGRPAHVLIHGVPGTGKTELARYMAQRLGCHAYEIGARDADSGEPASRGERFAEYALVNVLFGRIENALLVFDEAEDVFTGEHWTHLPVRRERHKAWTNRLLETTALPTIWLCNDIRFIDPAYLRRFDFVLALGAPPRAMRRRLLQVATAGVELPDVLLERVADQESFTPADAERIERLLKLAVDGGVNPQRALMRLLECPPAALAPGVLAPERASGLAYRREWIQVDAELPVLLEGLRREQRGSLLFCGAPGTGKTALAVHLARELGRPLMLRRASDVLDAYVGGSERRIAQVFQQASRDGAVLLIDEADSLLRSRELARTQWEVSQVNELLSQLDAFAGIVILTTNHAATLDHALQRRMDMKLQFEGLRTEHLPEVARALFAALHLPPPDDAWVLARLEGLRGLTVGDFVTALNALRLRATRPQAEDVDAVIVREWRLRTGNSRAIGFV